MIRQIFITPIKAGVSDAALQQRVEAQRKLKDHVPGIVSITVDRALGLYGINHAVVMTIDLQDMDAWNALLASEYHTDLGKTLGECFDADGAIAAQVEVR